MSLFSLKLGINIVYNNDICIIIALDQQQIELRRQRDGFIIILEKESILAGLTRGTIAFFHHDTIAEIIDAQTSIKKDFHSYPELEKQSAKRKLKYLTAIFEAGITTFTQSSLKSVIKHVANELADDNIPHWNTVYRWHKRYLESDLDVRSLAPKIKYKGNYSSKIHTEVQTIIDDVIENVFLSPNKPSVADLHKIVRQKVQQKNKTNKDSQQLICPSYNTIMRAIKKLDPLLINQRQYKARKVIQQHQAYQQEIPATRILQRVDIDHFTAKLIIIDDDTKLPLGHPTLTIMTDHYSQSILGFDISFSSANIVNTMTCMQHAIMPKNQLKFLYPALNNPWDVYGLPEQLIIADDVDLLNSDLTDICTSLGIDLRQSPAKAPRQQSELELYIDGINLQLLNNHAIVDFSAIHIKEDYDPQHNALIGYRSFVEMLHLWIIDIYQHKRHRSIDQTPAQKWLGSVKKFPPTLPQSGAELSIHLGLVEQRRIQAYGIEIHGLKYNCDKLRLLRNKLNKNKKVTIKYNPNDLSYIYALDPIDDNYLLVPALDHIYTDNKSLWQHNMIKNYAKAQGLKKLNLANLIEAEQHISLLIETELFKSNRG